MIFAPASPACFGLLGPGHGLWAVRHNKQRQALEQQLADAPALS